MTRRRVLGLGAGLAAACAVRAELAQAFQDYRTGRLAGDAHDDTTPR